MTREKIQKAIQSSDLIVTYHNANDNDKGKYYFHYNLSGGEEDAFEFPKIHPNSLFCHSVKALKLKQNDDGLDSLNYDLHILLVGTTLQPLMLSVSAINAEKIALIYTDDTEGEKNTLQDLIKEYKPSIKFERIEKLLVNSSEPHAAFLSIKKIIEKEEWQNKRVCIDITGGKKSMVGGGFLASSVLSIDTYYVDFEQYHDGKPELATEFINRLDNPYAIYNIELLSQANELFKHHNYQASVFLFDKIIEKLDSVSNLADYGLADEPKVIRNMLGAARCYMYWDNYAYGEAYKLSRCLKESQRKYLKDLTVYDKYNTKRDYYLSPFLYKFVIDRFLSAHRRWYNSESEQRGREKDGYKGYYDAMLRYFQCVEVMLNAYIMQNVQDRDYDPDRLRLSMEDIRKLCFSGGPIKKTMRKDGGRKNIELRLENTIKENELRERILDLNEERDNYVHVKPDGQIKGIQKAELLVKELMCHIFDKHIDEINEDIKGFAFKKSFDKEGRLC